MQYLTFLKIGFCFDKWPFWFNSIPVFESSIKLSVKLRQQLCGVSHEVGTKNEYLNWNLMSTTVLSGEYS